MPRMLLIVFVALALGAISVPSLFASPAQRSLEFMNSPISPLHPQPGSDGDHNDDHDGNDGLAPIHWRGPVASGVVWVPQADSTQMWIKTHQVGVGWWDADGQLHIELQAHGIAKIPAGAVMISIPWDAAGVLAPPGWQKMKRPENGEWVIVRIAD